MGFESGAGQHNKLSPAPNKKPNKTLPGSANMDARMPVSLKAGKPGTGDHGAKGDSPKTGQLTPKQPVIGSKAKKPQLL